MLWFDASSEAFLEWGLVPYGLRWHPPEDEKKEKKKKKKKQCQGGREVHPVLVGDGCRMDCSKKAFPPWS